MQSETNPVYEVYQGRDQVSVELAEEKQKNAEFFKRIQELEERVKRLEKSLDREIHYGKGMREALHLLGGRKP